MPPRGGEARKPNDQQNGRRVSVCSAIVFAALAAICAQLAFVYFNNSASNGDTLDTRKDTTVPSEDDIEELARLAAARHNAGMLEIPQLADIDEGNILEKLHDAINARHTMRVVLLSENLEGYLNKVTSIASASADPSRIAAAKDATAAFSALWEATEFLTGSTAQVEDSVGNKKTLLAADGVEFAKARFQILTTLRKSLPDFAFEADDEAAHELCLLKALDLALRGVKVASVRSETEAEESVYFAVGSSCLGGSGYSGEGSRQLALQNAGPILEELIAINSAHLGYRFVYGALVAVAMDRPDLSLMSILRCEKACQQRSSDDDPPGKKPLEPSCGSSGKDFAQWCRLLRGFIAHKSVSSSASADDQQLAQAAEILVGGLMMLPSDGGKCPLGNAPLFGATSTAVAGMAANSLLLRKVSTAEFERPHIAELAFSSTTRAKIVRYALDAVVAADASQAPAASKLMKMLNMTCGGSNNFSRVGA